jgi:hypothetical protein
MQPFAIELKHRKLAWLLSFSLLRTGSSVQASLTLNGKRGASAVDSGDVPSHRRGGTGASLAAV